ncbi:hypothetical protein LTS02_017694 [Friedmanniomyces endolithicus]|nr:hypothetical protein LTS02_017694 [Friedmanniomyces endolithicus]
MTSRYAAPRVRQSRTVGPYITEETCVRGTLTRPSKTGLTLPDTGVRDEHGMELMFGVFDTLDNSLKRNGACSLVNHTQPVTAGNDHFIDEPRHSPNGERTSEDCRTAHGDHRNGARALVDPAKSETSENHHCSIDEHRPRPEDTRSNEDRQRVCGNLRSNDTVEEAGSSGRRGPIATAQADTESSFGMGGTIIRRRIAELVVLGRVEAGKQDASEIVCTVNTAFANCAEIATQLFEATIRAAEAGFDITKKDISRVKTAAPLVKKVQNAVGYQRRKVAAIDKITNACPQLLGNGQLPKSADCQRALFTLVDKYSCPDVCALLRLAMFKRFETDAGGVNATLTKDQCPQRNDIFEAVTLAKAAGHESQVLGIQPTDTRARLFTMKHGLPFFASNLIAQLQQVASGRDPNPSLQPTLFPEREAATLPLSSSKSNGFGTAATPPVSLTSTTCTFEALNNGKTMPTISKLKASRKLAVETSGFMLITVTSLPETEWDILQTQMLTCVAAKASKEPSARSGAGSAAVQVGISYRKSGAKDGRAVYRAATGGRDPRAGPSAQPLLAEPSQPASEVHYEEQ